MHVLEIPTAQLAKDKYTRILQAHAGPGSQGLVHCNASHTEFIQQWTDYPNTKLKDLLDVSAICDATLSPASMGLKNNAPDFIEVDESEIPALDGFRGAP
jgi:hypothetical protein